MSGQDCICKTCKHDKFHKWHETAVMLAPVDLPTNLKYVAWNIPGALEIAWLEEEVLERLHVANTSIIKWTDGTARILVWDALRSMQTQQHIYEVERHKFVTVHPDLSAADVDRMVGTYVRPPRMDLPPPHTCGAAVDVTLLCGTRDDLLGQFDDFSGHGRVDYYESHPPLTEAEGDQARRRSLVQRAMKEAGFVGIPEEWWHFEFGTRTWAALTGKPVRYNTIQQPPHRDTIAARLPMMPAKFPILVTGVAQAFNSASERADALAGKSRDFYYVRTRTHSSEQLADWLKSEIGGSGVILAPSGLSAAAAAVISHMEPGQCAVVDKKAYYETQTALTYASKREGWNIVTADLSDPVEIASCRRHHPRVIFCDHPRNWHLTTPDLALLRKAFPTDETTLIVDTSLQPLQRLIDLNLADIVTFSLAKYPSAGHTSGGAIMGSTPRLKPIHQHMRQSGLVLAPEACHTVLLNVPFLRTHMHAVSTTARSLVQLLAESNLVETVMLPDLSRVFAEPGGQLVAHFVSSAAADAVEQVIGWNSTSVHFPLALACTFGASFTTFEHFRGRGTEADQRGNGSHSIGDKAVRIGVGLEDSGGILDAMRFALSVARINLEECATSLSFQNDLPVGNHG
jgi:D-alanyl-D-alanine dipeptidase